ncbi:hypothetical protein BS78_K153800 [Paspalum vaginatum]|uniref:Uncharacterized protein n=1 Tax=Paspalum vaginatum TaxID=158149 RepID=A0A9W7XC25_9POAL|nr:hypothetical protein BS78_K153800 [Paspalum vaginatum]
MAADDTATVFIETTLDTRLAVSFPARATTVADLKRRVSAEHATCFPRTGPIAVTSLQVKLDGSWFQLTDSMAVRAAFEWVKGPWRLLAEAHELGSRPLARKDAKCGTSDAEQNAGHPSISGNSLQYVLPPALSQGGGSGCLASGVGVSDTPQVNQQDQPPEGVEDGLGQWKDGIIMPEERSDIDLAASGSGTPLPNQEDKPQECVEDASGQLEGGIAMPQESSDFDFAAGGIDTSLPNQEEKPQEYIEDASGQLDDGIIMPEESADFGLAAGDRDPPPTNQQDKSHESVEHASCQSEERTTMLQESSDLGVAADKVQISAEPRGKKHFREEDRINESTIVNCGDNLSTLASSTLNAELSGPKGSTLTDQAKLNSVRLAYNLEDNSHGLGEKPSGGQKETRTPGVHNVESSNNESYVPPRVESTERDKSSDKEVKTQRGDKEEPRIAVCTGESSCKRTDVPHSVESMKEYIKRPSSNSHYVNKGKSDGATSTISQEHGPCLRRSHQRVVVRKVPISRAMKMYSFRC